MSRPAGAQTDAGAPSGAGARIIRDSRACSSVDRASASGAEGRRFESCRARQYPFAENALRQREREAKRVRPRRESSATNSGPAETIRS